jgi:hypothetical protein
MNSADSISARCAAYQAAKDGTIEFIESPGHGWAKVPVAWVEALDLIVSRCSPRTSEFVWLEEDCDLVNFCVELQEWRLRISGRPSNFADLFKVTHNSFKTTYINDSDAYFTEQEVTW